MATQAAKKSLPAITLAEVARHSVEGDLWLAVNGNVYNLSKFVDIHPGGAHTLLADNIAGRDATESFFSLHRSEVLQKYSRFIVATIKDSTPAYVVPVDGELSPVPYAEPAWLRPGFVSPYYNASHHALQRKMRYFFDVYVKKEAREHEVSHKRPTLKLMELMGSPEWNIHAMRMGPGAHLHGLILPGGVRGGDFDYFHEIVVVQELTRINAPGYMAGVNAGMVIGAPPLLHYATEHIRNKYLPGILAGKKFISLAISEAEVGSDVRGLTTWARKTPDGKHYIVTGMKKWITNGNFSDYFMTAVRTGENSLSMLIIERDDSVETRIIKTAYSHAAGTAMVTFSGTKVPVENLIGVEGQGMTQVKDNFLAERLVILARTSRTSRLIYEECFKWCHLRKVFGKPLVEQPVIRAKLAKMINHIEFGQAQIEAITYQMVNMPYERQVKLLAGPMALLKYSLSRAGGEISDDAVQIFGGRGITQGGIGVYVEQFQRAYKFDSILGGSEEVLADLGVKQAMRSMPKAAL